MRACRLGWMVALAVVVGGCGRAEIERGDDVIYFVPGAAGDGAWYDQAVAALAREMPEWSIRVHRWGAGGPFFVANFQGESIHREAESALARRIGEARGRILLIGHSAGGGVVLGALARSGRRVEGAVLLHPSVSPGYDLRPALESLASPLVVLYSEQDRLFLRHRTGTFGTYDNVRTPAAGHLGFDLTEETAQRVIQRPWTERDRRLGNDGGHFGPLAGDFVAREVVPLLKAPPSGPPAAPFESGAGSRPARTPSTGAPR